MTENICAVILAAGQGTRMQDNTRPKVMQTISGRPLIFFILQTLKKILPEKNIYLVVGYKGEEVIKKFGNKYHYIWQKKQKGTAHAAWLVFKKISSFCRTVIVFNGDDSMFLKSDTIRRGLQVHLNNDNLFTLTYCAFHKDVAPPLGGLKRNQLGQVTGWYNNNTEAKNASNKFIEIIGGFYIFNKNWFLKNYTKIKINNKGELPLTTGFLSLALKQKAKVDFLKISSQEWQSINTKQDLKFAREKFRKLKH